MSIESLCTGDTVVKQTAANSLGAAGGNAVVYTDGASSSCLVQTPSASEVRKYAARGMLLSRQVFFSENVGLTNQHRLKWTVEAGVALASPRFLRVLDFYPEGRPGENLLWVADCEEETTRREA